MVIGGESEQPKTSDVKTFRLYNLNESADEKAVTNDEGAEPEGKPDMDQYEAHEPESSLVESVDKPDAEGSGDEGDSEKDDEKSSSTGPVRVETSPYKVTFKPRPTDSTEVGD
ncbi:MAG TPA: hypothetical protein EYQ50_16390 [Verrucomicrobiales bacterium]|nr:hypothetical protein [Verrucomicrobiales bacterium]HIL69982.1 hypothetical protein [Verrucomicrobiota bacterium]